MFIFNGNLVGIDNENELDLAVLARRNKRADRDLSLFVPGRSNHANTKIQGIYSISIINNSFESIGNSTFSVQSNTI